MATPSIPPEAHISAISPGSLTWDLPAIKRAPTKHPRKRFRTQAMAWQQMSQTGEWAGFRSYVDLSADKKGRRNEPNRIVEIHAIAGAIGEQLALCWASEQDAQRILQSASLGDEHRRLVLRAVSESASHFLLGGAHSLGNLVIRVGLLDPSAGREIVQQRKKADFSVGSEDSRAWLSLSQASEVLDIAAGAASNVHLSRCAAVIETFYSDPRFRALEDRRGMDYHRLRPQSVLHASLGRAWPSRPGQRSRSRRLPLNWILTGRCQGSLVLVGAMAAGLTAAQELKREIPKSMRSSGIWYHEFFAPPVKKRSRT